MLLRCMSNASAIIRMRHYNHNAMRFNTSILRGGVNWTRMHTVPKITVPKYRSRSTGSGNPEAKNGSEVPVTKLRSRNTGTENPAPKHRFRFRPQGGIT
jgi:hypothetical protein